MRYLSARWALFGLAIVILVGYGLNRGVLIGSRIETARLSDNYPVPFYKKHCRYLFFNGIQQVSNCAIGMTGPHVEGKRTPNAPSWCQLWGRYWGSGV